MFFFFNDAATTEIYTLSLHDALPIFDSPSARITTGARPRTVENRNRLVRLYPWVNGVKTGRTQQADRKSTRLNSSHANISYAVFCLKKKKKKRTTPSSSSTSHYT